MILNDHYKKLVLLCILICTLTISYYFVIIKPKNDAQLIELQKQQLQQSQLDEQHRQEEAAAELSQQEATTKQQELDALTTQYRTECINDEKGNEASEDSGVSNCATVECVQNMEADFASRGLTGNQYIEACIQNKLKAGS